jgi:hypothetical protein
MRTSRGLPIDQARLRPHLRLAPCTPGCSRWKTTGHCRRRHDRATSAPERRGDGRPAELRGLPVLAAGVPGVAPNTNPVGELLRKERRRR